MTETLRYEVVDVFTDRPFAGNPLAVVLDGDTLSTAQMQHIAREFNLSETTFPVASTAAGADYRLRIFTPGAELPFAGHPSVGTAWLMHSLGRVDAGRVVQECGAGLLPLEVSPDEVVLTGGAPTVGEPLDPPPFLAAAGLDDGALAGTPVRRAGTGLEFGFVHVHEEALAACAPDTSRLAALGGGGVSVFSWADGRAHARVFAGGVGVPEDPATGSAALGLGAWLVATGLAAADGETAYVVEQGIEMGRPSTLRCTVVAEGGRARQCRVAGTVVPVARGEIRIPS